MSRAAWSGPVGLIPTGSTGLGMVSGETSPPRPRTLMPMPRAPCPLKHQAIVMPLDYCFTCGGYLRARQTTAYPITGHMQLDDYAVLFLIDSINIVSRIILTR